MMELLNRVEEARGKEKIEILTNEMSPELKVLFLYAYSQKYVFNLKDVDVSDVEGDAPLTANNIKLFAESILQAESPREMYNKMIGAFSKDDQEVLKRMIRKDMRVGVSGKSFNKAIGYDFIYLHPYNRCSSMNEKTMKKIMFPCYSQLKSDGKFADLIIDGEVQVHDELEQDIVRFSNRDGMTMDILPRHIMKQIKSIVPTVDIAISGELLYLDEEGNVLPREIGNGVLGSNEIDPCKVLFRVWDVRYTTGDKRGYEERLVQLDDIVSLLKDTINIQKIESKECEGWDDIANHYREMRLLGEEGTIIKNKDFLFKDGTSPDCIKLKAEIDGEVEVIAVTEGKGKWVDTGIGALTVRSSCGMMQCETAGLTDQQRIDYYNNPDLIIGKIITVRYNGVVQREGSEKMALYLPRMIEVRDDKHEADSLEKLIEQEKASIDMLTSWE